MELFVYFHYSVIIQTERRQCGCVIMRSSLQVYICSPLRHVYLYAKTPTHGVHLIASRQTINRNPCTEENQKGTTSSANDKTLLHVKAITEIFHQLFKDVAWLSAGILDHEETARLGLSVRNLPCHSIS